MRGYRLYTIDSTEQVVDATSFESQDDEAAIAFARQRVDAEGVELWEDTRVVRRLYPDE